LMKSRWRRAAYDATIDVEGRTVTRTHVVLISKPRNGAGLVRANGAQRHEGVLCRVGDEEITDGCLHQCCISDGRQRRTPLDRDRNSSADQLTSVPFTVGNAGTLLGDVGLLQP
jgi:hypothetical protein